MEESEWGQREWEFQYLELFTNDFHIYNSIPFLTEWR